MKIKAGQNIIVRDRRKGTFKATAIADFDTEEDEFYPVITRQFVRGMSMDWDVGEEIPCRRGISTIVEEKETRPERDT